MGKDITAFSDNGLSSSRARSTHQITHAEFSKHNSKDDQWILINGKVYDVTQFAKRHPGGAKIINHFAAEDATDAWTAFHNDKEKVSKHLKSLYVGDMENPPTTELQKDFRDLRKIVEDSGWMKPEPIFYILHFLQLILLEASAVGVLWYFGTSWPVVIISACLLATCQAQAGWTQHDYGHHSVFRDMKTAHFFHHLVIGFIKGASSHWWNFRHFQHHAKPNMIKKDPDIDIGYLFMLGDYLPKDWGKKKRGFMPYQWQQNYFFLLGPPLLLPIYFHLEVIYFCIKRRDWLDFTIGLAYFFRLGYLFSPFFGGWGTFAFYMGMRFLESHWFTWVTQMSHLPMEVGKDQGLDWFTSQLRTTCNVDPSWFNDWFTGHLNFQIEHHLFPTMPRIHFYKVAPYVKSMCKKHGIAYRSKPLLTAFGDIVGMLKNSGQIWYDAYNE